jgi:hypothetical protein
MFRQGFRTVSTARRRILRRVVVYNCSCFRARVPVVSSGDTSSEEVSAPQRYKETQRLGLFRPTRRSSSLFRNEICTRGLRRIEIHDDIYEVARLELRVGIT